MKNTAVLTDNLPVELKQKAEFCLWRYETDKDGRPTKMPYNPNNLTYRAKTNNPNTFSDYNKAMSVMPEGYGLGVRVSKGIAAADLDHCIKDGQFSELAKDIIRLMDCYTEVSPSGEGLRFLFLVSEDFQYDRDSYYIKNSKAGLEVYTQGTYRFLTVTGSVVNRKGLLERTDNLRMLLDKYMKRPEQTQTTQQIYIPGSANLSDDEIIEKASKAKNSYKFLDLWAGGWGSCGSHSEADQSLCSVLAFWTTDPEQIDRIFRRSGLMREKWAKRQRYREETIKKALENTTEHYTPKQQKPKTKRKRSKSEQKKIEQELTTHTKTELVDKLINIDAINNFPINDKGLGRLFAELFKDVHRYNPQMKDYMYFDGTKWVKDTESLEARKATQILSDQIIKYAADADDSEDKRYLKAVMKLCGRSTRENMLQDAKPIYPLYTDDLDKDDYVLNVENGTLFLHGDRPVFKPHNPNDMLSKICNVSYDPGADCPLWKKYLAEVMQDNHEKMKFIQKIFGLGLTGCTELECFFIFYGKLTRNGKGTACRTYAHMLGSYALQMSPESLAVKPNTDSRSPSGDIARLKGVRYVNASEPKKKMLLDTAQLKTLTGRDTITARHLHEREFEFKPKFKLVIDTNYLPVVNDDTLFSSDRVYVVSFDRHFTEPERDLKLKDKLKDEKELSGLLNWCIEGLRLYRSEGLKPPKDVKEATAEYRADSDKTGNFIAECLTKTGRNSKAGDVYKVYSAWCNDNGYGVESKGSFFAEMKNRGLFALSGTVNGITVRNIIKGYSVGGDIDTDENGFIRADPQQKLPFY